MPTIITIAREYGSGGRLIAQKVAEKLGLVYYDNQILDLAAMELGIDVETIRKVSEEKTSGFMYSLSTTGINSLPINDQVFAMQSKIIRHIASQTEDCIIVNGCADSILEEYNPLAIFIHAPLESRIERVQNDYREEHKDVKKFIQKKDKGRKEYYNYYTTNKWGQLKNFDLTINSDLGLDLIADLIVNLYKEKKYDARK